MHKSLISILSLAFNRALAQKFRIHFISLVPPFDQNKRIFLHTWIISYNFFCWQSTERYHTKFRIHLKSLMPEFIRKKTHIYYKVFTLVTDSIYKPIYTLDTVSIPLSYYACFKNTLIEKTCMCTVWRRYTLPRVLSKDIGLFYQLFHL